MEFSYGEVEVEVVARAPHAKRVEVEPQSCIAYGDKGVIIGSTDKHYDVLFDRGSTESVPKQKVTVL